MELKFVSPSGLRSYTITGGNKRDTLFVESSVGYCGDIDQFQLNSAIYEAIHRLFLEKIQKPIEEKIKKDEK